ncbi:MAG: hypothetical protein ACKO1X_02970 [Acidimicrobiales bacterium]
MLIAEVFGSIAAVLGVVQAWPQARRVRALGHSQGVSAVMWSMMVASSAAWLGYGIRISSPSLVASCVASGILNMNVVLAVFGRPAVVVPRFTGMFVAVMCAVIWLPGFVIVPLLLASNLSRVPQVLRSWKSRRDGVRDSAVSVGWMVTGLVGLLCWEVYSVLFRSVTLIASTTLALVLALTVAWLELPSRGASRGASAARA